ncbi:MAG: hypothetical protein IKD89_06880 [Clostridia bacterium]|nr:hypothetical protein [Clostridia bacterium]
MKTKALILSLLLLLSAFLFAACSDKGKDADAGSESGASETADTAESGEETGGGDEAEAVIKSAPYVEMMTNGKFYIHYTSSEVLDGETMEGEYKMAYDDKKLYMNIVSDDFAMTTISDETTMYLMDDSSKTYFKMSVSDEEDMDPAAEDEEILTSEDYVFVGTGEGNIGGRTLYYEEYSTGVDSLIRYYFDGDALYAIEGISDGESSVMYIIEMTDSVDPALFAVPDDYTEMSFG